MKYYPHTPGDIGEMLESVGAESVDSLFSDIPAAKQIKGLDLPAPKSEWEVVNQLNRMATANRPHYDRPSFMGAGVYRHFSPSVVDAVISRSEFYTSYTPYQAEASQGTLQTIFEYQSMMAEITGMDFANASVYDGATACAEAVSMMTGHTRKPKVIISQGLHPEYAETVKTYFRHTEGVSLVFVPLKNGITDMEALKNAVDGDTAGVIIQNPNCLGFIEPASEIGEAVRAVNKKALYTIAVNEALSLGLLKRPGQCGADLAVGDGGSLGLSPSFGGPHVGFMAAKNSLLRKIPGRLVGQTLDSNGKRAFCLTLQAREQHIRRDKATSNICSNQALCALAVTVYLSCVGKNGFYQLARLNMEKAHYMKDCLTAIPGFELYADQPFFNEFTLKCPADPVRIDLFLRSRGVTGGFITSRWKNNEWNGLMTFCATEVNTRKDIDDLAGYLKTYCREEVGSACTTA